MDELNAEAARLGRLLAPSASELARLREINSVELPQARRNVQRLREAEKQQRRS